MQKQFLFYFKDADVPKSEWVRYPFADDIGSGLTTCEHEQHAAR
jgi:hypothetical protein